MKHIEALCIIITTEIVLPKLKKWYIGSLDHPELRCPHDMEELFITYNQQIVETHYGFSEITTNEI